MAALNASRLRGFTLVEVLVALALMAAMATMAWRGIDGMLRSRDISQESLSRTERLQSVIAQWELDLQALQDSGMLNPITFDGVRLLLTRRQPEGMQLVSWSLRDGRLYRWASPVLTTQNALSDAYARSQQDIPGQEQLMALDGVSSWQMFFYRGNSWSNAQSSDDISTEPPATPPGSAASDAGGTPPPGGRRQLPSGVRMLLEFAPDSGHEGTLTRQVLLGPQS
ncbi:prepilin-type N-terminal cleavage/methylation domain-containing protein [Roseateles sp.]|jgi:general secretion pathway protein J|uniref:prepilin-type N-terminal cleavage/methylation domain-containing protein n=1 Tax=Roseateles sp. TaxID=1971397 RepID=UPI0037C92E25